MIIFFIYSAQRQKRKKPLLGRPFPMLIAIYTGGGFEKIKAAALYGNEKKLKV